MSKCIYRGWKEEGGYWYYFDPTDLALVTTALKDIGWCSLIE